MDLFRKFSLHTAIISSIFILVFNLGSCQIEPDKIDVLIIDGFSNHDWKQTTTVVKSILEKSDLFTVAVSTTPSKPDDKDWDNWKPNFGEYDVVIQNTNNIFKKGMKFPRSQQKSLEEYVKSGGGLYILHSANNSFKEWDEYNLMIGLGWRTKDEGVALQIDDNGKVVEIPIGKGKNTYHGDRSDEVVHTLTNHPINKGFPKAWKTPNMELYKYARGPAKNITVLSYAKDETNNINWPVEWVVTYGKGRVYNSTMGHLWDGEIYPDSYKCVGFQTTLIRATEWLATGDVSYKMPENFPTDLEISLVKVGIDN